MNYVLPLKFIAGLFVNKHNIVFNSESLVVDCIEFLDKLKKINLKTDLIEDFYKYSRYGFFDIVKELLLTYDISTINKLISYNEYAAFRWAALNGHFNIVKLLIEKNKINHLDMIRAKKYFAFRHASKRGYLDIVELLCITCHGDNNNMIDVRSLRWACKNKHYEIVKYLLNFNADLINFVNNIDLFNNVIVNGNLELVKYFCENGANFNIGDIYSPLFTACRCGHLEIVKYLYEKGANIIYLEIRYGCSAMYWASLNGHLDILKFLFDKNCLIRYICEALEAAVEKKHLHIIKYLLKRIIDSDNYTEDIFLYAYNKTIDKALTYNKKDIITFLCEDDNYKDYFNIEDFLERNDCGGEIYEYLISL